MDFTVKKELEALAAEGSANELSDKAINPEKASQVFVDYWPFLRRVLTVIRIFTGEKGDKAIDKIIEAGDLLSAPVKPVK